ncbi:MAG: S8 family serine peptidase, partial [Saprospiraceae bacterium]|nr:S8 family serine peptidase [Saprospiraceae bacterium]
MTTVAASTHNRVFLQELTLDDGSGNPITLTGRAMTGGGGPAPVVLSVDFADPDNGISEEDARLCNPGVFPPGTFSGQIVVCEQSSGRVAKGQTVKDGGASGFVLAQPNEFGGGPGSVLTDAHVLPAIHIDYDEYQKLLDYLDAAAGPVNGTFAGAVKDINDSYADIMASFSSRGPNGGFFEDLIVPNVTAPGVAIWAAYHQGAGGDGDYTWNVIQGTSMASPHVAGAGALLAGVHPTWTPAQIESALSSTAFQAVTNDDGVNQATPFAMGGGRVDLVAATQAGLLLDVSTADFENSDPRTGGDPTSLNLANMGNAQCVVECSWTRTVSNPTGSAVSWTAMVEVSEGATASVTPEAFTIDPGATQEIMVTVNVGSLEADTWHFGDLKLMTDAAGVPDAHLPIAFQPSKGDIPERETIKTRRDAGSQDIKDITSIPASNLTITEAGLAEGMQYDLLLMQDPNNGDPFDPIDAVWFKVFDVPEGAQRFVADVAASTAPDIDLFVGTGDTPGADTQVCSSTTPSFNEYCNLNNPAAGQYWVLVQNWDGSGADYDSVELYVGIVAGDEGNMTVSGPSSVAALEPYDLTVTYNDEMAAGQRWYGAATLGSSPDNPDDIGTINIDLHRLEDDVTKSVSPGVAMPGDMVTYTISVAPNVTPEDLTYTIIDTIPDGLTLVPGSATATSGSVTAGLDTVFWSGTQLTAANLGASYNVTTSADDPNCDTGFGGYVNLEDFGILAQAAITGDTVVYSAFSTGDPIDFYGQAYTGMSFTDDGFAIFDPGDNYGGTPWTPQMIPDADVPNNMAAAMWFDGEIFYDAALNHGVSLATAGSPGGVVIVEYDNLQPFGGSVTDQYDMEIIVARAIDNTPGAYEVVYAYDNLLGALPAQATVGVENAAGDEATALVNNGAVA